MKRIRIILREEREREREREREIGLRNPRARVVRGATSPRKPPTRAIERRRRRRRRGKENYLASD